jgi:hypothetical protein
MDADPVFRLKAEATHLFLKLGLVASAFRRKDQD